MKESSVWSSMERKGQWQFRLLVKKKDNYKTLLNAKRNSSKYFSDIYANLLFFLEKLGWISTKTSQKTRCYWSSLNHQIRSFMLFCLKTKLPDKNAWAKLFSSELLLWKSTAQLHNELRRLLRIFWAFLWPATAAENSQSFEIGNQKFICSVL